MILQLLFLLVIFLCDNNLIAEKIPPFYTPAGYRLLSEKQKEKLREKAEEKLVLKKGRHLFLNNNHLTTLFELVYEINKLYPPTEYTLYALGQSPAYLLEACNILNNAGESSANRYKIAFSSSWYTFSYVRYQYNEDPARLPSEAQLNSYIDYLSKLSLDPKNILKRTQKGEKIVFVENCRTGKGLFAFITILQRQRDQLSTAEQKQFDESIEFLVILNPDPFYPSNESIETINHLLRQMVKPFKCHIMLIPIGTKQHYVMAGLGVDSDKDRLVLSFPPKKWGIEDPTTFNLAEEAQLALFTLNDYWQSKKYGSKRQAP